MKSHDVIKIHNCRIDTGLETDSRIVLINYSIREMRPLNVSKICNCGMDTGRETDSAIVLDTRFQDAAA